MSSQMTQIALHGRAGSNFMAHQGFEAATSRFMVLLFAMELSPQPLIYIMILKVCRGHGTSRPLGLQKTK